MKILNRILLACGIVVAIGAAQNAFVVWDLSQLSNRIVEATTVPLPQVDAADRIAALFRTADQQLTEATDAIRFVSSSQATAEFKKTIADIEREIGKLSSASMSPTTMNCVKGATLHLKTWAGDAQVLLGDKPAASIVAPYELEADKSVIVRDLAGLVADALRAADDAKGEMIRLTTFSRWRSIVESIAALLAGVGLSIMAAISITNPMGRLKNNMAIVEAGNLDTAIQDAKRRDEIGAMSRALEVFRQQALEVRRLEQKEREARDHEAALESARVTELQTRNASFQLLFLSNPVSMWVRDIQTNGIIAVNDAALLHYGYSRERFLGMRTSDLLWLNDNKAGALPVGRGFQRHRKSDGSEIEVAIYESFLTYEDCSASLVAIIDLTERRRAEQQIRHLAHHDSLTDLPDRPAFDERFASSLQTASDSREPMALLCLDLDHFKEVNDVYGHAVGDKLLVRYPAVSLLLLRAPSLRALGETSFQSSRSTGTSLPRQRRWPSDFPLSYEKTLTSMASSFALACALGQPYIRPTVSMEQPSSPTQTRRSIAPRRTGAAACASLKRTWIDAFESDTPCSMTCVRRWSIGNSRSTIDRKRVSAVRFSALKL